MHPDWPLLLDSWRLALAADGYSPHTVRTYRKGVLSLATWLGEHHPTAGPTALERAHVRGWLAEVRATDRLTPPGAGSPGCATSAGSWWPRGS